MKRLLLLLTLLAWLPVSAQAWWNPDWKYRRKITLNTTPAGADVKDSVAPALVAVRLHSGNFLFSDAKLDGTDIRFIANDDKTPLRFFIESFDANSQLALAWVQLPSVSGNSAAEFFFLYSGNDKVGASGEQASTYDDAQLLSLEFNQSQPPFKDGSKYASAVSGESVLVDPSGLFGNAGLFDGAGLRITPTASVRTTAGGGLTFSAWIKPATAQKAELFSWGPLQVQQDGEQIVARLDKAIASGPGLKAGSWNHVAVVVSDRIAVYLNGAEIGTAPVKLPELAGDVAIGSTFHGSIDSLGVAAAARSAAAIKLAATQAADGKLLGMGEGEASEDSGSTSYIKILFSSLTLDAKVVIAFLALMFAIAVFVMVNKAIQVSRTENHNTQFLRGFNESPREFLNPDSSTSKSINSGTLAHSSLLRLYETGMHELRLRLHGGHGQLTAESVASIKASIDSSLVRENQRLHQRMVLLTIAISGGPFLGLLGTVVGVMITFAAIAAQGDVNINAIAPGIAAALLATVAGLAVAIPSLFGYNYLITRIKAITADMQAFSDEFICKMAETQSTR